MKLFFILFFAGLVLSQTEFKADFIQSGPNLSGRLTGTMYYSEPNKAIRLEYPASGGDQITLYDEQTPQNFFVFNKCGGSSCQSSPLKSGTVVPKYYKLSTDTCSGSSTLYSGDTCTPCARKNDVVSEICVDVNGSVKRITLTDGTRFDLGTVTTSVSASDIDPTPWNCQLNCGSQMDIQLVIDESSSISGNYNPSKGEATYDWKNVRDFVHGFVSAFTIAPDKVNFGLVQFASWARMILPQIIGDSAQFQDTIDSMMKNGGGTNISSGVEAGLHLLRDTSGARILRKDVTKVMILMTDGKDNVQTYNSNWKTLLQGVTVFSIGVGGDVSKKDLTNWASDPSFVFTVDSFNILASAEKVKELSSVVCSASGSSPCPGCLGLCSCGKCLCPDSCNTTDICSYGICNSTYNTKGGCLFKPKTCDDGDACTDDKCDPVHECQHTRFDVPTRCDDGDACTDPTCDKVIGCLNKPRECNSTDPCYINLSCKDGACTKGENICDAINACVISVNSDGTAPCTDPKNCKYLPIDCTYGDKCILPDCDKSAPGPNGCLNKTRSCDDGNACSKDLCDSVKGCYYETIDCDDGDACTDDTCDPIKGCVHTPFNVTERCSNGDICSVFSCDPKAGCVSSPFVCPEVYNETCIAAVCDSLIGCVSRPLVCTVDKGLDPNCYAALCDENNVPAQYRSNKTEAVKHACKSTQNDNCKILSIVGGGGAAVLGIGAIIGIIIAAVVCAGGTVTGAVLGYNKVFSGEFENKSQIYEPETVVGTSNIFENKA